MRKVRRIRNSKSKKTSKIDNKKKRRGAGAFIGRTSKGFDQARRINKEHAERRKRGYLPLRFRLPVGEEAEVIILDEGEPFFMYEHNWKGSSDHYSEYEVCIKDKGICPLCQKLNKEGYFVMMLTCIDLRPFKDRNGKKHKYSKKLLPVKSMMIPKFERLLKRKGKGSFRGMRVRLARDNEKGAAIGDSIEYVRMMSESKLAQYDEKAITPVDYEKLFPYPTESEMRKKYGVGPVAGSEDTEEEEDLDDVDWDEEDDEDD